MYVSMNEGHQAEIKKIRKENGMSQIVVKDRNCLNCGRKFRSYGHFNRMCEPCGRRD